MGNGIRTIEHAKSTKKLFSRSTRECEHCGEKYQAAYKNSKYCGSTCSKSARDIRTKVMEPPTGWHKCQNCGEEFPWWSKISSKKRKYCSYACSSAAQRGSLKVRGESVSLLTMRPCRIDREEHCHKRTAPFEITTCRYYDRWHQIGTQFHCDCKEGFTP